MRNRWDDAEAARCTTELELRAYTSRLLGCEPALVLHGGGNTSVKRTETDLFGDPREILHVKGSGWDLASIEPAGFAPVRLPVVRRLAGLPALSDRAMARELVAATTDPGAPAPSVETLLHAVLPHRFVDHTHADAVLTLTNTPAAAALLREVYGERVVVVGYVMPGFALARVCAERFAAEAGAATVGMVLAHHGVFSFGATARESYERMIALVTLAEEAIGERTGRALAAPPRAADAPAAGGLELARLRRRISAAAGHPMILTASADEEAAAFARDPDVAQLAGRGPVTPDHVIRTKRVPLVGRDVDAYVAEYRRFFERHAGRSAEPLTMLDPAPRIVLDAELGLVSAGRAPADARIAEDIYRHTIRVVRASESLGGYRSLSEAELFDVEYWELEQAKLARAGRPLALAGEVALVTGAAGGIGRACADALLAQGAAVVALDVAAAVERDPDDPAYLGLRCDVTDREAVAAALRQAAGRFGGLDVLVLNAGVFPPGAPVAELDDDAWAGVLRVNLDANLALLRAAHPFLVEAPRYGRVVVVGSRNVAAPGRGAAAYSVSKAGVTQLARVAALEWAADGIRVNVVHPDAVFDTGAWTPEVLAARAAHYGIGVEEYKRRNLLGTEIASADVAALVTAMCGPAFARTTGAQVPIDGGSERVI